MTKAFYRYWGKARPDKDIEPAYHLLPYHCLDVAAVADQWWQYSAVIRRRFAEITDLKEEQARAWVLFFIALHDYGKCDLRFQRKAPEIWKAVNAELSGIPVRLTALSIKAYYHGPAGLYWFYQDLKERFSSAEDDFCFDDNDDWLAWYGWLASVTGHHGIVPDDYQKESREYNLTIEETGLLSAFKQARLQWLEALEHLFLNPVGLSLNDTPPVLEKNGSGQTAATMLAGFCSVSDWLGSSDYFKYDDQPSDDLRRWYDARLATAGQVLQEAGVISQIKPYQNIDVLLNGHSPRQVQCLVEHLPKTPGLTLIEASTGSGKTEAALAYAWQLLALGMADSIIFALPTQATANAMLRRLEKAAPLIFANKANVILAHGRAKYEQNFINLKQACDPRTAQGHEEAWVQCGNWLAQSRKRVFLGQIGVCTIDQVLVSVLPVKHKFVRGFGIGRSVLIIDEVHAYDSYMYGLLDAVLEQQRLAGGSAVLLSATLPSRQKEQLAKAWGCDLSAANTAYPLISHFSDGQGRVYDMGAQPDQQPTPTSVKLELIKTPNLLPDDSFIQRLLDAVEKGAQVCLVCNLVAVAQQLYHQLQARIAQTDTLTEDQLLLFHSRFIFADRQQKERNVLDLFGAEPHPENARSKGHLLIATQVVEQSLDLDFDWLIAQLCPVDLLFQRMGRLHRHRRSRPEGFADPVCTVLLPTEDDYELHELIYGNSRVLWRAQQCLQRALQETEARVTFPAAYREWIETVYCEESWPDEPEWVLKSYEAYEKDRYASQMTARQLINSRMNELSDNDGNVAALTRDGEMSLNLNLCYINDRGERYWLDGEMIDKQDDSDRLEAINLNSVAVPKNWSRHGRLPEADKEGLIWLPMRAMEKGRFVAQQGDCIYFYHASTGLNRMEQPEENP